MFGSKVIANDAKPGTTTLTSRLLEVTNKSSDLFFNRSANEQTGVLEISTTDVVLSNTQVQVGSKQIKVDLACRFDQGPNQGKVTFSEDISNNETKFIFGQCTKSDIDLPEDEWTEAGLTVSVAAAHAQRIALIGNWTQPEAKLTGLVLQTQGLKYGSGLVTVTPSSAVKVATLGGPVKSASDVLRIDNASWTGMATSGADVEIGSNFPINGKGDVTIGTLSTDRIDALFALNSASLPALASIVPIAVTSFSLKLVGSPAAPSASGTLQASSVQLAAMGLQDKIGPINFQSDSTVQDGSSFAFDVDLSTPQADVTLGDPNGQNVRVKGQVKKLHLKGAVLLDAGSGNLSVAVDPGGLVLDANVQASVSPLVLGSPVTFVGGAISIGCPDGLKFSKSQSVGNIDLSAQALVMATPSLVFANPDQRFVIQAPLKTEGAATIQFDVGTGRAKIFNARIIADNLEAKALNTAKTVSVSGITFLSPDITLGKLDVKVTEGAGLVEGENLHFLTDDMTHDGPPYFEVKLAPNTGLKIRSLTPISVTQKRVSRLQMYR